MPSAPFRLSLQHLTVPAALWPPTRLSICWAGFWGLGLLAPWLSRLPWTLCLLLDVCAVGSGLMRHGLRNQRQEPERLQKPFHPREPHTTLLRSSTGAWLLDAAHGEANPAGVQPVALHIHWNSSWLMVVTLHDTQNRPLTRLFALFPNRHPEAAALRQLRAWLRWHGT